MAFGIANVILRFLAEAWGFQLCITCVNQYPEQIVIGDKLLLFFLLLFLVRREQPAAECLYP